MPRPESTTPPLTPVEELLYGAPGAAVDPVRGGPRSGAVPGAGRVQASLPVDRSARRAAARSVLRRTNHTAITEAWLGWALASAARVGALSLVARRGVAAPVTQPGSIAAWIGDALGRDDLLFVAGSGTARPNSKPVVQVLGPEGSVLAWAKIGWNDLTRALVAHEADVLRSHHGRRPDVTVPEVIGQTTIADRHAVLLSPLPLWAPPWQRATPMTSDHFLAIAELDGTADLAVGESPWWSDVRARIDAAEAERPARLDAIAATLVRAAPAAVRFGTFHGDLVPWNVFVGAHGLLVWDWERGRSALPVGFDTVHWTLQCANRGNPARVAASVADRTATLDALAALGVPAGDRTWFVAAYLLEMELRFRSDAHLVDFSGLGDLIDAYGTALDDVVAELGGVG